MIRRQSGRLRLLGGLVAALLVLPLFVSSAGAVESVPDGQNVLAKLGNADLGKDPPAGLSAAGSERREPDAGDGDVGLIGEMLQRFHGTLGDAVAVWRVYADADAAVHDRGSAGREPERGGEWAEELHPGRGEDASTCLVTKTDHLTVTCRLAVSGAPLQTRGVVTAPLPIATNQDELVRRASAIAAWARDRWRAIERVQRDG